MRGWAAQQAVHDAGLREPAGSVRRHPRPRTGACQGAAMRTGARTLPRGRRAAARGLHGGGLYDRKGLLLVQSTSHDKVCIAMHAARLIGGAADCCDSTWMHCCAAGPAATAYERPIAPRPHAATGESHSTRGGRGVLTSTSALRQVRVCRSPQPRQSDRGGARQTYVRVRRVRGSHLCGI